MKNLMRYLLLIALNIIILYPAASSSKWEKIPFENVTTKLTAMDFLGCDTGLVAENDMYLTCDITIDGGLLWNSFNTQVTNVYDVKLMNGENGIQAFIAGYSDYSISGILYYTLDNGNNWNVIYFDGEKKREYSFSIYSIFIADEHTLFLSGINGAILKSQDTGNTWKRTVTGTNNETFTTISFGSKDIGYAASCNGTDIYNVNNLYKSIDSGNTWKKLKIPNKFITISKLIFTSTDNGFIFGSNDSRESILKTTDGGVTWENSYISNRFGSITNASFFDSFNGYAINDSGKIIKTTNGGLSWILDTILDRKLNSIKMISKDCGYACGDSGSIYKFDNYSDVKNPFQEDNRLVISPNPASDFVNITITNEPLKDYRLMIYDINGIKLKDIYLTQNNNRVNIEELPVGIYFIVVLSDDKSFGKTIIKL